MTFSFRFFGGLRSGSGRTTDVWNILDKNIRLRFLKFVSDNPNLDDRVRMSSRIKMRKIFFADQNADLIRSNNDKKCCSFDLQISWCYHLLENFFFDAIFQMCDDDWLIFSEGMLFKYRMAVESDFGQKTRSDPTLGSDNPRTVRF